MPKTSCGPTKKRCGASITTTATPTSASISSSADLDPSTNEYVINFTVEEGERYTFGDMTIESNIEGITAESLGGSIETNAGNVYSAKEVEDTIIA